MSIASYLKGGGYFFTQRRREPRKGGGDVGGKGIFYLFYQIARQIFSHNILLLRQWRKKNRLVLFGKS